MYNFLVIMSALFLFTIDAQASRQKSNPRGGTFNGRQVDMEKLSSDLLASDDRIRIINKDESDQTPQSGYSAQPFRGKTLKMKFVRPETSQLRVQFMRRIRNPLARTGRWNLYYFKVVVDGIEFNCRGVISGDGEQVILETSMLFEGQWTKGVCNSKEQYWNVTEKAYQPKYQLTHDTPISVGLTFKDQTVESVEEVVTAGN